MPIYRQSICYEFRPSERDCLVEALNVCGRRLVPVNDERFLEMFPAFGLEAHPLGSAAGWMTRALTGDANGEAGRHVMLTDKADHIALSEGFCEFLREYLRVGRRRVAMQPVERHEVAKIRGALDWLDFALVAFHEFGDICRIVECPVCGFATQPCGGGTRMCTSCAWVGVQT